MTHPTVAHSKLLQAHSTAQEKLFRPATGKSSLGFHAGLVVDEVVMGQIFLLATLFSLSALFLNPQIIFRSSITDVKYSNKMARYE